MPITAASLRCSSQHRTLQLHSAQRHATRCITTRHRAAQRRPPRKGRLTVGNHHLTALRSSAYRDALPHVTSLLRAARLNSPQRNGLPSEGRYSMSTGSRWVTTSDAPRRFASCRYASHLDTSHHGTPLLPATHRNELPSEGRYSMSTGSR